jgi:hypothetical protein
MTITVTDNRNTLKVGGSNVAYMTYTFTTDASGDASEETATSIAGTIQKIVTIPDGDDTPTAGWDFTLIDEDGVDVLGGAGGDRDIGGAGATETITPYGKSEEANFNSKLTFTVANGGNAKAGTVKVYYT